MAVFTGHHDVVYSVKLALGALWSASADRWVRRYDLHTLEETDGWHASSHSVTCLAASEQHNILCSGAEDGQISLWTIPPRGCATLLSRFAQRAPGEEPSSHVAQVAIYALAVEPKRGEMLVSGGADHRIYMFELRTRRLLHTLPGHSSSVRALCFTPQAKLISSGGDCQVFVWSSLDDAEEGETARANESRANESRANAQIRTSTC